MKDWRENRWKTKHSPPSSSGSAKPAKATTETFGRKVPPSYQAPKCATSPSPKPRVSDLRLSGHTDDPPTWSLTNHRAERRMVSAHLHSRRMNYRPAEIGATTRKISTLSTLAQTGARTWWNRTFRCLDPAKVRHADRLGGAGTAHGFRDVCLVTALRELGLDVAYTRSGPFRALRDGNDMVRSLGYELEPVHPHGVTAGRYVKWHASHFTAVVVSNTVRVIDNGASTTFDSIFALGRPDEHKWFRLRGIAGVHAGSTDTGTHDGSHITQSQCAVIRQNRASAFLRRAMRTSSLQGHGHNTMRAGPCATERNESVELGVQQRGLVRPVPPEGWEHPPLPRTPSDLLATLQLPRVTFLEVLNRHPRDHRLQFYETEHVYLIDGRPTLGSVTGVVHSVSESFDAPSVIARMRQGPRWPRPNYLKGVIDETVLRHLTTHPGGCHLVHLLSQEPRDEAAICDQAQRVLRTSAEAEVLVRSLGLEPDIIESIWDRNRRAAANAGTWMHWTFDAWLNRVHVEPDCP